MDHQFTRQMQEWLNSKHESDAEIIKGADMLFRLNRNRFYHVRATRQPQAYRTNIEYELNKFLKIRLDNMTIEEVRKMNDIVIPEAQAIIAEGEAENNGENQGKSEKNGDSIEENASTDDTELPSSDSDGVAVVRKGKRKGTRGKAKGTGAATRRARGKDTRKKLPSHLIPAAHDTLSGPASLRNDERIE